METGTTFYPIFLLFHFYSKIILLSYTIISKGIKYMLNFCDNMPL